MATKYDLTKNAKAVKESTANSIINDLENGPGKFTKNLENLKGVLYNPTTQTTLSDKKVVEILAHGEDLSDQRFVTFSQAQRAGMHIEKNAKGCPTVNYSIEKNNSTNEITLKGRTVNYFNAKDLLKMEMPKAAYVYTNQERLKLNTNLAARIKAIYDSGKRAAQRNGTKEPSPLPERKEYKDINHFMNAITAYTVKNTMDMNRNTENIQNEYFRDESGKGGKQENNLKEIEVRSQFRKELATALLNREISNPVQFRDYLKDPKNKENIKLLTDIYKKNPEKLAHDINAATLAKKYVKEKVMFVVRKKKTKEEIQSMEDNLKNDPKRAGKTLKATDYYHYKNIDVKKMEDRIANSKELKSENEKMVILKAQSRAEKTLKTQILNVESYSNDTIIMSKSLCDKIADARKAEGLESDPKKFLLGYMEMKSDKGPEVSFKADINAIQKESLPHERIINRYANGKEGESINIVEKMKANELAKAEKRAKEGLKARAGEKAKSAAKTKAAPAKSKTATKNRSRKGPEISR